MSNISKTATDTTMVNENRIWNWPWAIDWHHDLWPWMTMNRPRSKSHDFLIKYLEYEDRYNVEHNKRSDGKPSAGFRLALCTLILD